MLWPAQAQEPQQAPPQRQGPVFPGLMPIPLPAQQPAIAPPQQQAPPQSTTPPPPARTTPPTIYGGLNLNNVSLTEVIDLLAQKLKINYILDPRVKGGVFLNTYGETKDIDTRSLLETILGSTASAWCSRANCFASFRSPTFLICPFLRRPRRTPTASPRTTARC